MMSLNGNRGILSLTLLLVIAGLEVGCYRAKPMAGAAGVPLQKTAKVVVKDSALHRWMRVAQHKAERTDADLLRIRLGIQNTEDDNVWCDIQVVFYDEDGFELEKTNWQPLLLLGDQVTYYETVSLSARARDYTVFLGNARETRGIK